MNPIVVRELDYDGIHAVAEAIDLRPNRSLGQYFAHDPEVVRRIASTCEVSEHDRVLEIGSGMGAVTLALLGLGAWVDAVEIDAKLARQLPVTAIHHCHSEIQRLTVSQSDVLDLRRSDVQEGPTTAVVSLPYEVATAAVLHLLAELPSIRSIVAVVDSAARQWQASTPGTPGYEVSVAKLRYLADMRPCGDLAPSAFWPRPDRAPDLVRLDRID